LLAQRDVRVQGLRAGDGTPHADHRDQARASGASPPVTAGAAASSNLPLASLAADVVEGDEDDEIQNNCAPTWRSRCRMWEHGHEGYKYPLYLFGDGAASMFQISPKTLQDTHGFYLGSGRPEAKSPTFCLDVLLGG
jgi:hypothetical protein